jgi:hypothetical protein
MQREETEQLMQEWAEQEIRTTIGADPGCTIQDIGEYEPRGPNAWFGYVVAEIAGIITLRRMAETWRISPPYSDWRHYAPALRRNADNQLVTTQLPPDMTLAEWYRRNELLLNQDPDNLTRIRTIAVALLPRFEAHPECWEAISAMDDDFSRGSFREFLEDWCIQAPVRCRPFIKRVAEEFGLKVGG